MNSRDTDLIPREPHLIAGHAEVDEPLLLRSVVRSFWWRAPIAGYIICVPLTLLCGGVPLLAQILTGHAYFFEFSSVLCTVVVALCWGSGPAFLSIALGWLTISYVITPLLFHPGLESSSDLVTFLLVEVVIVLLITTRSVALQEKLRVALTAQKRAEELEKTNSQLLRAQQQKDRIFSGVSHELKTPLTTIQGQAQLGLRRLNKQVGNADAFSLVRLSFEKIDDQANRLHTLVDDLLDVSVLAAGKMQLQLSRCDLARLCQDVVEDQNVLTARQIVLSLPDYTIEVQGDTNRLRQIISNLVTNALKYSFTDSLVQLQILQQGTTARISVTNHGVAIPADQHEKIFEPFFRADNVQASSGRGWGLGLSICKDIVQLHHGRIWVESSLEGETTFFVELPLA